jgi:hypothetical protein
MDQRIRRNYFHFEQIFSQKTLIGVAELSIAPVIFFSGRRFSMTPNSCVATKTRHSSSLNRIPSAVGSGKIQTARLTAGQAGRKAPTHGADF